MKMTKFELFTLSHFLVIEELLLQLLGTSAPKQTQKDVMKLVMETMKLIMEAGALEDE